MAKDKKKDKKKKDKKTAKNKKKKDKEKKKEVAKAKTKKLRKKKSKKEKTKKAKLSSVQSRIIKGTSSAIDKPDTRRSSSLSMNVAGAISKIRSLKTTPAVDNFTQGETRVTVLKAIEIAKRRINSTRRRKY